VNKSYLIFSILIAGLVSAQNVTKTTVAVIDFEAEGISQVDASILTNRFRSELVNTQAFSILERGQMDDILHEVGFQNSGCTSSECMIEIGKLLNVQKMIGGSLGKLGSVYTIDLRLIDVQTGRIDKTITEDHSGDLTDLLQVMKSVAMRFAALETQQTSPVRISSMGSLQIVTEPAGAEIYLNERKIGETPFKGEQIKAGEYRLRITKEDYQDYETTIAILENKLTEVSQNLAAIFELYVVSDPENATVFIDNKEVGKTPVTKKLPQGSYVVKISKPNFIEWTKQFNLTRSGKITAKLELTPEYLARMRQTKENAEEPVVEQAKRGGGNTWLWIGAGAVVAGGAAYLILHSKEEPPSMESLPDPPARPSQ
jgi:hypothetical protein